ncbi:MAG: hypothetical protein AUJ74_04705 [Candidatus Omnitrophica bacterium CG1_02_44_16]|nr:MAG: hypothetical protein AUJ74_04705 [Candidatus Omnitrophica bacterium CG1_02_44_16]PIY82099.1 MAG: hypothetical protein COY78_08690 [Candidatus Omnitrophica bacterium CG_4_10_14_0_8_um_filter_44_12]PIZ83287.1 MAG: hypothetical protein COX96_08570 [Candidatus Omnitrophica bacterium CG_4_10_14_0_2_um_filter_44_9]
MKNTKGFTLIEVIVVVIILGILASIAGVQYTKVIEKSRWVEAREVFLKAQAGYDRLKMDGEEGTLKQANFWTKLGMSDPNNLPCARRKFLYAPVASHTNRIQACRYLNACQPSFANCWVLVLDPPSGKTPEIIRKGSAPSF